jgi:hypothetical protein
LILLEKFCLRNTHVVRAMAADLEKSDYQEGCPGSVWSNPGDGAHRFGTVIPTMMLVTAAATCHAYSCRDGWRERSLHRQLESKMEKLNTEKHELSIDELDAASGGALYQPVIVVAIVYATAVKIAVSQFVHGLTGQ